MNTYFIASEETGSLEGKYNVLSKDAAGFWDIVEIDDDNYDNGDNWMKLEDTITLYHATNVNVSDIGKTKKTMFFTASKELADMWGDEHYEDYDIITVEVSPLDVVDYIPTRPMYAGYDFELLEAKPELILHDVVRYNVNAGYIFRDVTKFNIQ